MDGNMDVMAMIATSLLAGTIFIVLWGAFLGMIRGRNRSILRLILVVISLALALFLRSSLVGAFTTMEIEPGLTLEAMLIEEFTAGQSMSAEMAEVIAIIVEILVSLVAFIAMFALLSFVTWLIIFPICKIFVKKEKNKEGKKKAKKGVGALIGLAQGILIAFVSFVPVSGMMSGIANLVTVMGENMATSGYETTIDSGITSFAEESGEGMESGSGANGEMPMIGEPTGMVKFYNDVGGWFFDMIASVDKVDEITGKTVKIKFGDATDVFGVVATFAVEYDSIKDASKNLSVNNLDSLLKFSQAFDAIGEQVSGLQDGGRYLLDKMLVAIKEEVIAEIEECADENVAYINAGIEWAQLITAENLRLDDAGELFEIIAGVVQGDVLNEADAEKIVTTLAENPFILKLISAEQERLDFESIASFDPTSKELILDAIVDATAQQNLQEEVANAIIKVLGLAK